MATIRLSKHSARRLAAGLIILLMTAPGVAMAQEDKPAGPVNQDLLDLLDEYNAFRDAYPDSAFVPANSLLRIRDDRVLVDATASGDGEALRAELEALGLENGAVFGLVVSGWLPISAIAELANLQHLHAIRPAYLTTIGAAGVFHVAPGGDDAGDGSANAPWATLQHAAASVQPGDSVLVRDGNYVGFEIAQSGTAVQPIVFKAASDNVVVDAVNPVRGRDNINVEGADYVVIEGFRVRDAERAGIRVVIARGVVVKNNVVGPNGKWGIFTGFAPDVQILDNETFGSADEHGIYVSNSDTPDDNPVIRGNLSYDNNANGIQLNGDCFAGGDGVINGAMIEDNVVHDNGFKGFSLISIRASAVRNNVIYDNGIRAGAGGIHLTDEPGCGLPTTGTVVVNNTIVEPRIAGLRTSDDAAGNVIFNNLIVSDRPLRDEDGGNLIDEGSNLTLASAAGLFVDAATGDYHLASGSAAIDAGVAAFEGIDAPPHDHDGMVRPQGSSLDVGAYEMSGSATTVEQDPAETPDGYILSAAFPNPFNPQTHLTLAVAARQRVAVAVYDALGRRVARLHDGMLAPHQTHRFAFEAAHLPSGLYVIRATGETFAATRRVVLVR